MDEYVPIKAKEPDEWLENGLAVQSFNTSAE